LPKTSFLQPKSFSYILWKIWIWKLHRLAGGIVSFFKYKLILLLGIFFKCSCYDFVWDSRLISVDCSGNSWLPLCPVVYLYSGGLWRPTLLYVDYWVDYEYEKHR
jgi:hypothetical protein